MNFHTGNLESKCSLWYILITFLKKTSAFIHYIKIIFKKKMYAYKTRDMKNFLENISFKSN